MLEPITRWYPRPIAQAYVYRVYDAADELVYIGTTINVAERMYKHRRESLWAGHIHRVESEGYPDRNTAWAAEREAIRSERPKFNILDNPTPLPRRCMCHCHRMHPMNDVHSDGPRCCPKVWDEVPID